MLGNNFQFQLFNLWKMALPLMLSSLSGVTMVFIDRLILAQYTLEAHNAAVEATNIGWAFLIGLSSLAGISQVFVSQNVGAKQFKEVGKSVWQMIWLSLASFLFFLPLSYHCPHWIFGDGASCTMQKTYLSYMLFFSPLSGLSAALCGFYIGKNKPLFPTIVAIGGNIVNAFLCYALVFGIEGVISSQGILGAVIAMNGALSLQVIFLLYGFLSLRNRKIFGTNQWHFDWLLLKTSLKVGLPSTFFTILEITGWAFFYKMMAGLSRDHLTVAGIVQNILILSFFFNEGMSRAIAAKVGHAIGAKKLEDISDIVKAGFFSVTAFALFLACVLWLSYENLIDLFLKNMTDTEKNLVYSSIIFGCINTVIYKYLEGIRMVIAGALIAAADTLFLLISGSACVWLGMVLPIYFFVYKTKGSIEKALILCSAYTLVAAVVYLVRFYRGAWKQNAHIAIPSRMTDI